jgi:hypothetical protein
LNNNTNNPKPRGAKPIKRVTPFTIKVFLFLLSVSLSASLLLTLSSFEKDQRNPGENHHAEEVEAFNLQDQETDEKPLKSERETHPFMADQFTEQRPSERSATPYQMGDHLKTEEIVGSIRDSLHGMRAQANEISIGQMFSNGEVKVEMKENFWKKVDAPLPIFQGMKIKTEKGSAAIALSEGTQIEIGQNSLFFFAGKDRLDLIQGHIRFRIEPNSPLRFKVGKLWVVRSHPLQRARDTSVISTKDEGAMGSITVHAKGAVTVNSIQGPLYVINEDRTILSALSTKESVTFPSTAARSQSNIRVASKGTTDKLTEKSEEGPPEEPKEFLGRDTWKWIGKGPWGGVAAAVAIGGGEEDDDDRDVVFICR